jgi:cytochrome c
MPVEAGSWYLCFRGDSPPPKARPMRALMVLLAVLAAGPALAGPGEDAFNSQCATCHTLTGVSTPNGPSLKGVVWRKIADLPDFTYSDALKAKVGTWSPDRLDAFLKNSQAFAPGTDMFFDVDDDARRKAIIDYLQTK